MRKLMSALLFLTACRAPQTTGPQLKADVQFDLLCQAYWEFQMESEPTWATYLGDHRFNDRLPDPGPQGRSRKIAALESLNEWRRGIDPHLLNPTARVSWEILGIEIGESLDHYRHKFYQWELDQMDGPQVWFLEQVNYHPTRNEKDYADFATRLEKFPTYMAAYLGNLREGLKEGRIATRIVVERILGQLKEIVEQPLTKFPQMEILGKFPKDLSDEARARLKSRIEAAIDDRVRPAYAGMREFLEREYLPRARTDAGLWALPGGEEAYRYCIRKHTSLPLTAKELHKIGLEEMASIHEEMKSVARTLGFSGGVKEFIQKMRTDKAMFFQKRDELLEAFRLALSKIDVELPRFFGRLPKIGYQVKAIEEYREKDSAAAFYYNPPEDLSRPGIFYANTYDPASRPRFSVVALAAHEGVPGHHLQNALAMELMNLPKFRRFGWSTAFGEGWALYSERLVDEMGQYQDPVQRFGMLSEQAWRAARLVVDTGMHAFKWTRRQAIDYMRDNVAMSDLDAEVEVDRYIIWPGQALAYKVGQREIQRLRAWAQAALGPRFDVRAYHDEVLKNGAIPLPVLRLVIQDWVRARR